MKTFFTSAPRDYDYPATKHVREIGKDIHGKVWRQIELCEDYRGEAQQQRYGSGLHPTWSILEYDSNRHFHGLEDWASVGYSENLRLEEDLVNPSPSDEWQPSDPVKFDVSWFDKPLIKAGMFRVRWIHFLGETSPATYITPVSERGEVLETDIVQGGAGSSIFEALRDKLCGTPSWRKLK